MFWPVLRLKAETLVLAFTEKLLRLCLSLSSFHKEVKTSLRLKEWLNFKTGW